MTAEQIKEQVLNRIAKGEDWHPVGKVKWRVGSYIVHLRYRTNPVADGVTYSYNINPNTLTADFEVWICSNAKTYYLIPIEAIKQIYENPNSYVDSHHPEIRVANIDTRTHRCVYARGAQAMDFSDYYQAILETRGRN